MWERSFIKNNAKIALTGRYWTAFAVCLVAGLLGGGTGGGINFNFNLGEMTSAQYYFSSDPYHTYLDPDFFLMLLVALLGALIAVTIAFALSFFLGNPIMVGKARFFIHSRNGYSDFGNLFSTFRTGQYLNVVKGMALRTVYTFLWSLLLIIPGIIKGYAYSMVPYILAENPNLNPRRALEISEAMTQGEKMNIFVLDLSFIGWNLLGALCCGVGVLFVNPYVEATYTELYGVLRYKAISQGICHPTELGDIPYAQQ